MVAAMPINAATPPKAQTVGSRLRAARTGLSLSQEDMARKAGIPIDTYKKYETDARTPGGKHLARLSAAGIDIAQLLTGAGPMMQSEPRAEQPPAGYQAVNVELMSMVVSAVEGLQLLATPEERAALIALAYDYMIARASSEKGVLDAFLAQWSKSAPARPSVAPETGRQSKAAAGPTTWPAVERRKKAERK